MADRQSDPKRRDETPDDRQNGVPGAFGKGRDFHNGQSGVSHVRGDWTEIQPSEDVDNEEIKKDIKNVED